MASLGKYINDDDETESGSAECESIQETIDAIIEATLSNIDFSKQVTRDDVKYALVTAITPTVEALGSYRRIIKKAADSLITVPEHKKADRNKNTVIVSFRVSEQEYNYMETLYDLMPRRYFKTKSDFNRGLFKEGVFMASVIMEADMIDEGLNKGYMMPECIHDITELKTLQMIALHVSKEDLKQEVVEEYENKVATVLSRIGGKKLELVKSLKDIEDKRVKLLTERQEAMSDMVKILDKGFKVT